MSKHFFLMFFVLSYIFCFSQSDTSQQASWHKIYRASATRINDLVDTKLDVRFDYDKAWMYGKELVTLHPHFYPTDSLNLDAKGLTIHTIDIIRSRKHIPLEYTYDGNNIFIHLDRVYKANENYTIYIDYISKPDERKLEANAVAGAKGLYFINPKGEDKTKSIQIWTQGETEFNSAWFPTIDRPNQKTLEEINMTVPAKYVSMSNGLLVKQKNNGDGTRTDTWKLNLPNAPYLFFMGVGDYAVIKDSYKGKEVSYYVEKEYASVARKIFGLTPEMISLYSKLTGVDYPWPKYVQIVGRDDKSFSMENTSTTLHGDFIEANARELVDGNFQEQTIAHELFHQWFGDYVTCESWANITLNESFADFGEALWNEHKYGKDEGDATIYSNLQAYLSSPSNASIALVHFYYADKDDVFDNVSYPKGGCILHMLRNYVGDSAFFKSLNLYLTGHKFGNAEAQDLRLAFEQVTGQDLNWFWNQWYYGSGHPKLDISYSYDAGAKESKVFISQTQNDRIFKMPFAVDVYTGGRKTRYNVWISHPSDTFSFPAGVKPDLINVDGDKILLCEKNDHKTLDEFIYQYKHAGGYVDRREAIDFASDIQTEPRALGLLKEALHDKSMRLRELTLSKLNPENDTIKAAVEETIRNLAVNDPKSLVRADAIEFLGKLKKDIYKPLFLKAIGDSSYTIAGNALEALSYIDDDAAEAEAKKIPYQSARGTLKSVLLGYMDVSKFDSLANVFANLPISNEKFFMVSSFAKILARIKDTANFKRGIDLIVSFRDSIPQQYRGNTDPFINDALKKIAGKKDLHSDKMLADYVRSKLPANKPD
ncbi:MAG TPA: M1 family aminopeptidase [Chitinophagaceae bacterium]|nr:M1 family aminopeptidase [Chitinophagaceae bacterium]